MPGEPLNALGRAQAHSESRNGVTPAPGPTPDPWVNLGEAQIGEIVLIENEQFHDLFWDIYSFLSV